MTSLKALPWLVAGVLLALWSCEQRKAGALSQQLADAQQVAQRAVKAADSATAIAQKAIVEAQTARQAAQVQVRRSEALRTQTEASNAQASQAREAALRLAADSGVSLDTLRATVRSLVAEGRRDSIANRVQRTADSTTISRLLDAIRQDSLAIQTGVEAQTALLHRAEASEAVTKALSRLHTSRCGVMAGYGATASLSGTFSHGPTVMVGCRVFP